ncbi:hypothetical protein V5799_000022 [Amblyomma americanum]|uniref:MADF domain-containing protein n=2 Tax=Amblyomma americanum TaxID=6943 RepID=A0AAQ4D486_AMBAM
MATFSKAARLEYNDRLITAVQKHPILWDSSRMDYKDHRKKAVAWAEVVTELGCDSDETNFVPAVVGNLARRRAQSEHARWKSLRDTFIKKHRAWKDGAPSGSGADAAKQVRWPYFHLLMFLKDQVDIGSTFSNSHQSNEAACGATAETVLNAMFTDCDEPTQESCVLGRVESPEPGTSYGCPQTAPATPLRVQRAAKRKRRNDERARLEDDMEKVDQLIKDDRDQASLYGQIVAHKLRNCPTQHKQEMELELLQFIAKYTFNETE